jgi:hypothetical protein
VNLLVTVLIKVLEGMFLAGVAGSALVLAITTVEDFYTLLEPDEPEEGTPPQTNE